MPNINLFLTPEMDKKLKRMMQEQHLSKTDLIFNILNDKLNKEKGIQE